MTDLPQPDLQVQHDLLMELGEILHEGIPEECHAIELHANALGGRTQLTATVTDDAGTRHGNPPEDCGMVVLKLRKAMYVPGAGTWFSMHAKVERPGRMEATFDSEAEPTWNLTQAGPGDYVRELMRFPRDPDKTPAWLQDKLPHDA